MSALFRVLQVGFVLAVVSQSATAAPRIHNFADDFLAFWERHEGADPEEKVAAFKLEVVPLWRTFYEYKFAKAEAAGRDVDTFLKRHFALFSDLEPEYRRKLAAFSRDLQANIDSFMQAFPDFDQDLDIYLIHSLGEMDGGSRTIDGVQYFIFGVDGMAKYHAGLKDDAFFHHEIFHFYHVQHFAPRDIILDKLWMEGLATYVSHWLNPDATLEELLLDLPEGLVEACQSDMEYLVSDLTSKLDSQNMEDYTHYFLMNSEHERIPKRAGYYLGYLIAQRVHGDMSLDEMVRLSGDRLSEDVRLTLEGLHEPDLVAEPQIE